MMVITIFMVTLGLLTSTTLGQYQQSQDYEQPSDCENRPASNISPRSYGSSSPEAQRPAQEASGPKPTPVAILKQINRHNEDGSYTYGFEGGDGSFKIETKLANGDVKGKYGFVDDTGKVRVVEYGANQYGFQPAGEGITVAPPTLVDDTTGQNQLPEGQNFQDYDYQQPAQQRPAPAQARPPPPPPPQRTEAIYARPQQPLRKPSIFTPAAAPQSPILRHPEYEQAPQSQAHNQGPVQFNPAPLQEAPVPRAHQAPASQGLRGGGGILDQLARDYALPQNAAPPLHDISFGYY